MFVPEEAERLNIVIWHNEMTLYMFAKKRELNNVIRHNEMTPFMFAQVRVERLNIVI